MLLLPLAGVTLVFGANGLGVPSHVFGGPGVEMGTGAIKPSTGELLRIANDGRSVTALHSRGQIW